ncbi:MAG TPA: HAD-IA family hydrolase [Anaerolineales bacterium]|nr:HAD-IA family hydrolase [Anaerolineales bacterium]
MIFPNDIKAIFFDLDGTLRHSVPSGGDVFTNYVRTLGLAVNDEARLRAMRWEHLYWANSVDLRDDLLAHSGETENFWIEYSRRRLVALGASPDWSVEFAPNVSKHMGEFYKPESVIPEDVRRVLPQLKQSSYILAVISNREKPFHDLLNEHGIGEFFDFSLAAGEVNTFKPDPGVFEHALRRVNLSANEAIYVGDNYYADVVGARRAGLRPVLYDPIGIFPDPDCETIRSFDELNSIIKVI